jgi:acetyl-CoA synthetase
VSAEATSSPVAAIENLLAENRRFPPDAGFAAQANAKTGSLCRGRGGPVEFWARLARARLDWDEPFTKTLEWDLPFAKWFVGGELNVAYNCVDRHVENGLGDKVAYHWIGEPGETRTLTYADLHARSRRPPTRSRSSASDRRSRRDLHADDPGAARSRCSPAPGSARPTRSSSRGFSARRWRAGSTTAEAKLVITPTASYRRGKAMPPQDRGRRRGRAARRSSTS